MLPTLASNTVDFVVTSPPYWNILHKKDHKPVRGRVSKDLPTRHSDNDPRDIADYEVFLGELVAVFGEHRRVLSNNRYLAVMIGDFRHESRYYMFHSDLAQRLETLGYVLKGITILHHQYVLVLRNETP